MVDLPTGDDIQVENGGYARIHNAILETLAKANLAPLEFRIVSLVLRKTYGFNKKDDVISITQFEGTCGASRRATITAIQNLLRLGVLRRDQEGTQRYRYGFNKYFETWLPETFVSRHAGRSKNFHPAPTSEAVELVKPLGTSEAVDTRTSEAIGHQTSEAVDTHKRQVKDKLKKERAHDPNLDNAAVIAYREVWKLTPNEAQRSAITAGVTDVELWRSVLVDWRMHNWKPGNVPGQLEKYNSAQSQNGKKASYAADRPDPEMLLNDKIREARKAQHGQPG